MIGDLYVYEVAAEYRVVPADLSSAPTVPVVLPAAMTQPLWIVADGTHIYTAHGTTLARMTYDGVTETLTVPATQEFVLDDDYIWCGTLGPAAGQQRLIRVPKATFDTYAEWDIPNTVQYVQYRLDRDANGHIWIGTSVPGSPADRYAQLYKFDTGSESFTTLYTITNYRATPDAVKIVGDIAYVGITATASTPNTTRLVRVDLNDGTTREVSVATGSVRDVITQSTGPSPTDINAYLAVTGTGSGLYEIDASASPMTVDRSVTGISTSIQLGYDGESIYLASGSTVRKVSTSSMTETASIVIPGTNSAYNAVYAIAPDTGLSGIFVGAVVF